MDGQVTEPIAIASSSAMPAELRPRILSGILLGVLALGANWAGPMQFAVLVGAVALALSWEWGRIVRGTPLDPAFAVQAVAVTTAIALAFLGGPGLGCVVVAVGAVLTLLAASPRQTALSGLGTIYVGMPAIALVWLRSDAAHGVLAILFIYAVVWATDIFAFLCGKLIGGPKLWPRISPNKTWAGTLGGLGFAAVTGLLFGWWIAHPAPITLAVAGSLLSVAAQLGDLAESALKRAFGIKHASLLIPGHGGFMDRMDGIVAAAVLSAAIALAINPPAPARALLFWS